MRRFDRNQHGFTLVELMAAVLITVVIVAATMTTVVTSNRANVVNTQVADTQQNVRLAIDLLSRDIKLAGFNYNATDPATGSVGACNATIGAIVKPVGLLPQDQTPTGADTGTDSVSMVLPVMNTTGWTLTAAGRRTLATGGAIGLGAGLGLAGVLLRTTRRRG